MQTVTLTERVRFGIYIPCVKPAFQKQALERLEERIRNGENIYDILQIPESYGAYYVDKIRKGLCGMSYTLYDRIMKCSEEDADVVDEEY